MLWLVLLGAALVASITVNRSMTRWYRRTMRDLKRREAIQEILLRKQRKQLEKLEASVKEMRETCETFERLAARNELEGNADPAEWLLHNRKITLSQYLKAKKLAERRGIRVIDACLEIGSIDNATLREALAATDSNGDPLASARKSAARQGDMADRLSLPGKIKMP